MVAPRKRKELAAVAAAVLEPEPQQLVIADVLGEAGAVASARRGRGRPPGAVNRRTRDMIEFLEAAGFEPPMLQLAKVAAADTAELASALRCTKAAAFDRQQAARIALLPYWHSKQPAEVSVATQGAVGIMFGVIADSDGDGEVLDGDSLLSVPIEGSEENQ